MATQLQQISILFPLPLVARASLIVPRKKAKRETQLRHGMHREPRCRNIIGNLEAEARALAVCLWLPGIGSTDVYGSWRSESRNIGNPSEGSVCVDILKVKNEEENDDLSAFHFLSYASQLCIAVDDPHVLSFAPIGRGARSSGCVAPPQQTSRLPLPRQINYRYKTTGRSNPPLLSQQPSSSSRFQSISPTAHCLRHLCSGLLTLGCDHRCATRRPIASSRYTFAAPPPPPHPADFSPSPLRDRLREPPPSTRSPEPDYEYSFILRCPCNGGNLSSISLQRRQFLLRRIILSTTSTTYTVIVEPPCRITMEEGHLRMSPELEQIDGEIQDIFRALSNGFQKLDKIKDAGRQSKQLEDLTGKMRECKRMIKDFDRVLKEEEGKTPPEVNKQLNEKKQSMIKELNSYVALRKTYTSSLGNKRVELFDNGNEPVADDNVQMASTMSNQQLIDAGKKTMDETDQTIERSKQVVEQTIEVGTQTASALKGQTEQMGRIVNELDTINFSIKKASQLVKEIGRQVATDKCIMLFLFLIVCGVIAIIVVKIVNPSNKNIRDLPGLAPPAPASRRLLSANGLNGFY